MSVAPLIVNNTDMKVRKIDSETIELYEVDGNVYRYSYFSNGSVGTITIFRLGRVIYSSRDMKQSTEEGIKVEGLIREFKNKQSF